MTNREWVTLLYFFARHSHQLCLIIWPTECQCHCCIFCRQPHQSCLIPWQTECEWHCISSLPGSLINHVSSHDQQIVSATTLFLCWVVSSSISHPMTNREWEWHCLISLPGNLINYALSHDQQLVSDATLFFPRQSHQLCLIPWSTGSEWHCFVSFPGSLIVNHVSSHDQQLVSDTAFCLCQAVSCLIPWPTECEWNCFNYLLTASLSPDQQIVSLMQFSCHEP